MHWLELKIPPLVVWLICAGAMRAVTSAAPGLSFALAGRSVVALLLVTLGLAVVVAGVRAFREKGTTVNPHTPDKSTSVVSGGVYSVTRNPMYLGFLLVLAGWAAYLANAGAVMFLPAFVAYLTRFQIKPEERALRARFGTQYSQYLSRVRRWI